MPDRSLAAPIDTAAALERRWIRLTDEDADTAARLRTDTGVDFAAASGRVWETDDFVYLPVTVNRRDGDLIRRERIVFALGRDVLVTLQPAAEYGPFGKALARIRRTPHLADTPYGVMYALLYALNESSGRVIEYASEALESMNDEIALAHSGYNEHGEEIGVSDMQDTIARMNEAEEIVSRCQETQLLLARAARHLRADVPAERVELTGLLDILIADINGVKEHASYEHDKVRYLQQSIMTSLDVKQNQIVKVFTIITAVFLPPTLVATFYGMNFTNMPELAWEHGFLATTLLTLVAAMIPLWYIRRRGWLR